MQVPKGEADPHWEWRLLCTFIYQLKKRVLVDRNSQLVLSSDNLLRFSTVSWSAGKGMCVKA